MSVLSFASIETLALLLGAGLAGVSGARFGRWVARLPRADSAAARLDRRADDGWGRRLAVQGVLVGFGAVLACGVIVGLAPRFASLRDAALCVGGAALGGYLLLAVCSRLEKVAEAAIDWQRHLDLQASSEPVWTQAAWIAQTLAGGTAVLTILALLVVGSAPGPALLGVPIGAAVPAVVHRVLPTGSTERGRSPPGAEEAGSVGATASPEEPERRSPSYLASTTFALVTMAVIAGMLLAYEAPIVRTVFPDAYLVPLVAIAAVLVVGAAASAWAAGSSASRRQERVALAVASSSMLGGLTWLALDASGLGWNVGLFGAELAGVLSGVGAAAVTSRQRDWTARGGLGRAVDAVGVTAVTIVPLVVAYLLAGSSGYWSNPNFVPAVGVYGVGLAAVGYLGVYAAVGPITAAPGWNSGPVPLSTGEFPPSVPNPRRVGAACSRLLLVSASPVAISFLLAVGPAGSALAGVAPALWESAAARASGVFLVALIAGSGLAAIVARTAVLRRGTPHRSAPAAPSFPVGVLALVLVAVLVPGFVAGPLIEIGVLLGFSTMFPAVMVGMRPRRDDAVAAAIPETTRQAMPVDAPADGLGYETVVVAACALGGVVLPAMFAASWMGHL